MVARKEQPATDISAWTPEGAEEKAAVRRQLEKVVSSDLFANSKRYPSFLRYVVEETLEGRSESLKERTLGVVVFSRRPDYDTNEDHIVRSIGSEVRKRLMLYYQEPGRESEIRIELHPRAYAPVFRQPQRLVQTATLTNLSEGRIATYKPPMAVMMGIFLLLGGAGVGFAMARFSKVGQSMAGSSSQTLVQALAPKAGQHLDVVVGDMALAFRANKSQMVSLEDYKSRRYLEPQNLSTGINPGSDDVIAVARDDITESFIFPLIARVFESLPASQVSVINSADVTDRDFEEGNAILIGGPSNIPWMQLFENRLNFRTEPRPGHQHADIRNVVPREGEQALYPTDIQGGRGYGRIAYIPNLSNSGMILLVGGPGKVATVAAANFATDPAALQSLFRLFGVSRLSDLPSFEVLLELDVRGDVPLQSKVIAWRKEYAAVR